MAIYPSDGSNVTGNPTRGGLAIPPPGAARIPHYNAPLPPQPDLQLGQFWHSENISLKAQEQNLEIDLLFNQALSTEIGQGWSMNLRQFISSFTYSPIVTVTRGDMTNYGYQFAGASGGISTYTAANGGVTTLAFDGTTFQEKYPDGHMLSYRQAASDSRYFVSSSATPGGALTTSTYTAIGVNDITCLTGIQLQGGNRVTLAYSVSAHRSEPRLNTITDFGGRIYTIAYSGADASQPLSLTRPNGCETQYSYSSALANADMIQHVDPSGFATNFGPSITPGQPVTVVAGSTAWTFSWATANAVQLPGGGMVTYSFDATTGFATAIHHAEGFIETPTFDTSGRVVMKQTPAGTTYSVTYDPATNQIASQWDGTGNVASAKYDVHGNMTTLVAANGYPLSMTYASGSASRNPINVMDADGIQTSYTYYTTGLMQTMQDGRGLTTSFIWDTFGNLTAQHNPDGGIVSNSYDTLNRLIATTDPLSRTTTNTWDAGDNLVTQTNPLGQIDTYVYQNCLVIARIDPLNNKTSYTYDRYQNVLTTTDPLSNVTTNVIDSNGYQIAQITPVGSHFTAVYNAARQRVADQDALSNYTSYSFDTAGRRIATQNPIGAITTDTLDAQGRILTTTDPLNNVTSSTYGAAGISGPGYGASSGSDSPLLLPNAGLSNLVSTKDMLGGIATGVFSPAGRTWANVDQLSRYTSQIYDPAANVVETHDAAGNVWTSVYATNSNRKIADVDPLMNRTTYVHDVAGQLTQQQDQLSYINSYTYDPASRQIASTNPLGQSSSTVFDAAGRATVRIDPLGNSTTTTFDAASNAVQVQDPRGYLSSTVYDAASRAVARIDALSNRWTQTYDPNSRVIASQDPLNRVSSSVFDNAGRQTQNVSPSGLMSSSVYDVADRVTASVDPTGAAWSSTYDQLNRNITQTNPLGFTASTTYDPVGNATVRTDANGHAVTTSYDALNRPYQVQDPLGGLSSSVFDAAGRNTEMIDPRSGVITLGYDPRSLLTVLTNQDGYAISQTYDGARRMTLKQSPNGDYTSYTFDAGSRQTGILYGDGSRVTNVYDPNSNRTSMTDSIGQTTYSFDALNRASQQMVPGALLQVRTFDAAGQRTGLVDPDGGNRTYQFDRDGRISTYQFGSESITYSFDPASRVVGTRHSSGVFKAKTHDASGQIIGASGTPSNAGALSNFSYTFDPAGNKVGYYDTAFPTLGTYVCDPKDRLLKELSSGNWNHTATFAYDPADNLTWGRDTNYMAYTVDLAGRITTAAAGAPSGTVALGTYTFDNSGNMSQVVENGGTTAMSYDKENRLVGHALEGVQATYLYDGLNKKKVEITENGITTIVWDGEDYLQGRFTPNANAAEIYWVSFPLSVAKSSVTSVTVSVSNVGTNTWTLAGGYQLGSQAPAGNTTWGVASVALAGGDSITAGARKNFTFNLTAPSTAGVYPLQWRMQVGGVSFGQISDLMQVQVV